MGSRTKKRVIISVVFLLVLIAGLFIWMKQPAQVTEQDVQKAEEVAVDEELLNAIETGSTEKEDSSTVVGDSL